MPTYYINADTGNDSTGTGTSANPWLTISKAHDSAASGDTIICQDSTATFTFADKTFTKSLTIRGEQDDASGAVFDGGSTNVGWTFNSGLTITIQKIKFQNIIRSSSRLFSFSSSSTISFDNCIFYKLRNNSSSNVSSGVISPGGTAWTITISNCLFNDCRHTAGSGPLFSLYSISDASTFTIKNSTIYFLTSTNNFAYIYASRGFTQVINVSKNNIIANDTGNTITWSDPSNSDFGSQTNTYTCTYNITSPVAGTGNITSNPLFVDGANDDFRLQRDSPAIATGVLV